MHPGLLLVWPGQHLALSVINSPDTGPHDSIQRLLSSQCLVKAFVQGVAHAAVSVCPPVTQSGSIGFSNPHFEPIRGIFLSTRSTR